MHLTLAVASFWSLGGFTSFSVATDALPATILSQADSKGAASETPQADRPTIAGQSMGQYAEQLDDESRVVRLRAIKSLGAFGSPAAEHIVAALTHKDAGVRYIAAVHLGHIGGESLKSAVETLQQQSEGESSYAVKMAIAFALCNADVDTQSHLQTLSAALDHPDRGTSCSAAELLGDLGSKAEPVLAKLRDVHAKNKPGVKGGDYHRGGAAMNAIRKITAT
ncbi:HEAT repeat domain-containing protein [Stieleria varia]|uniref:HEAT repeat protein n=1 Tax=Stieleria varia TaxID=2528005 RepID=A0A5C5ZZP0_9BACT|nr:HEAT repeat domain-containing protein [Stieleria varia]TWT92418.1 hypothetical protein Pla52n_62920 [Stieleria varia]